MKNIVGLKELRNNIDSYISKIEKGESFTIVRRSKPVFKISPVSGDDEKWETVIDFTKIGKKGISLEKILSRL
ncbi:MAG: type II toxin-antitoxin system prevent-host-death family antitoxin [Candidatus Paceibacterota bacterium]